MNTSNSDSTHSTGATARSSRSSGNRAVAAGLAVGALGGAAAGLVFGVPGLSSAAAPSAVVRQVDEPDAGGNDGGVEVGMRLSEALQPLVDDGTLTSEQAEAVVTQLVENRPERGDRGGRRGGVGPFGRGVGSEALTDLLGVDAQELRQQLRGGATLAEIAEAQGVEAQAVVDELVAELAERVENAVENGRIDQAEADQRLADAEARIADMVNNGRPDRPGAPDSDD